MQLSRKNKILNFSFCLFLALLIGLLIGTYLIPSKSKHVFYINPFDNKIEEVTHLLQHYYFEELTINDINDEAIVALLQSLDPFSSYIPKKDAQRYDEALTGKFDGIGIQFNILHDTVLVVNVVPNGPSQKVGLMPGDKIIVVDGETIAGV
ncbi:MAG TPA: PDZ domain-containing protein, partial [Bacteroidales bacterium]|nr:PDZ domain-containing protein [Bacteroidales bacterium]